MVGPSARILRRSAAFAAAGVALSGASWAAQFSVGPSAPCTFATINQALAVAVANGDEPDAICVDGQIVSGPFNVDLDATGDLDISGCLGCAGTEAASLMLNGGRGFIVTAGGPTRRHLTLRNLGFYNNFPSSAPGRKLDISGNLSVTTDWFAPFEGNDTEGGALRVSGPDAELVFTRTGTGFAFIGGDANYNYSVAGDGGLVLVENGATARFIRTSFAYGRAAGHGGAIACRSGGAVILEDSRIADGVAGAGGAGISADGCTVTVSGKTTITRNRCWDAQFVPCAGGGVLASNGSLVTMTGPPRTLVFDPSYSYMLGGNEGTTGASLLAVGSGTSIEVSDGEIVNEDASAGASIAAADGASLSLFRSTVEWSAGVDAVVSATGPGTSVLLESDSFRQVSAATLLRASGGAHLTAAHVTANGNPDAVPTATVDESSSLDLFSSLLLDGDPLATSGTGAQVFADCVFAFDFAAFPPPPRAGSYVSVAVAGEVLQWPGSRVDLRVDSPATDFCDTTYYTPVGGDVQGEVRPFDQPPAGSYGFGLYDVGADESRGFLFADFEEGDCSEWSSAVACS